MDAETITAPDLPDDEAVVAALAGLSPIDYDRRRVAEAGRMGCRTETLDRLVEDARRGEARRQKETTEPDAPPEPDAVPMSEAEAAIEIANAAWLTDVAYDQQKRLIATRIGITVATLDRQVAAARRAADYGGEGAAKGRRPWLGACQTDSHAEPRPNLFNAMLALRDDPRISDLFASDEMLHTTILQQPVPGTVLDPAAIEQFQPRAVADTDVSLLQELLQASGLEKIGKDVVHQAVDLRGRERGFHPLRAYLDGLQWDGSPRAGKWLHTYLGAVDDDYHSGIGGMFLIAMVARIFDAGCKCDYMLILEGPQGLQKSTVCEALAGEWFSDGMPDLHSDAVRVSQHLRGKWLLEVAEMSAMSKAESAALKAFITRREENFTPKYGRKEVKEPRQCVFIGTTNKETYLRDETGGRRFWPAKVRKIELAALRRDRDQLFAEAVQLYRSGAHWWPDEEFERQHIAPQQEARYDADAWEQAIAGWLHDRVKDKTDLSPITILTVAHKALYLETPRIGRADQNRISAALERLGWQRGTKQNYGVPWEPAVSNE